MFMWAGTIWVSATSQTGRERQRVMLLWGKAALRMPNHDTDKLVGVTAPFCLWGQLGTCVSIPHSIIACFSILRTVLTLRLQKISLQRLRGQLWLILHFYFTIFMLKLTIYYSFQSVRFSHCPSFLNAYNNGNSLRDSFSIWIWTPVVFSNWDYIIGGNTGHFSLHHKLPLLWIQN